jgi:hypothetical protein
MQELFLQREMVVIGGVEQQEEAQDPREVEWIRVGETQRTV